MSTAQLVLNALSAYGLKQEGQGRYRANSPLRPGSNSHAFTLTIADDEHGSFYDHVSQDAGSLYDLAKRLNIETPRAAVSSTKRAYKDMSDYAAAHGLTADELKRWMWREAVYQKRPALEFMTHTGRRWRFIDEKGGYIHERGYTRSWYGLSPEILESIDDSLPLVICNGEVSVVSGQVHGLCAVCITAGEKGRIPDDLLSELESVTAPILIALDCDPTGRKASAGMVAQLKEAGLNARAVDLGLTDGGDLADFCMLHGTETLNQLKKCSTLSGTSVESVIPSPLQHDYGLPKDKIIGHGRSWVMLHSDNLRFLPQVTWALKPYIPSRGLVVIYGPSGTGKSFLALWFALQIAQQKPVLYMAYEGEYGYQARIRASQNFYHFGHGITLTLGQVDLMSDDDFMTFIDSARKVKPSVVFVDTLARSMSGLDENSTRDMGIYITRCNLLMSELDCSVVIVHHTSKAGAVERGSVALRGASDVMIRLEDSDERVLVECAKTKDGKPFQSFYIRLHSVDTMLADEFGQPVFTPVAVLAREDDLPESVLTKHQHSILSQMVLEIYTDDGMTHSQIKEACSQMSLSTLNNALSSLKKRGYIAQLIKRDPYTITQSGRDALETGKPWVPPLEDEAQPAHSQKPPKQTPLIPHGSKYHEAGL